MMTKARRLCFKMERIVKKKSARSQKNVDITFKRATLLLLSLKCCWFFAREDKGAEFY